jgi:hypothetical protein
MQWQESRTRTSRRRKLNALSRRLDAIEDALLERVLAGAGMPRWVTVNVRADGSEQEEDAAVETQFAKDGLDTELAGNSDVVQF